jgi:peptidoglycan DL-endopeptidase LytE
MRAPLFLIISWVFLACSLEARPKSGTYANPDVDELRLEIDDLKHALHTTQVDLSLLDEKHKKQDNQEAGGLSSLSLQVSSLEKKVLSLETTLNKISSDLRTLNTALSQTTTQIHQVETQLSSQDERLNEVNKLKGTLTSIAKAVGNAPTSSSTNTYRVKRGDSLEKIAKDHHTSADALRKINHLSSDRIIVGQELRVHNDSGP